MRREVQLCFGGYTGVIEGFPWDHFQVKSARQRAAGMLAQQPDSSYVDQMPRRLIFHTGKCHSAIVVIKDRTNFIPALIVTVFQQLCNYYYDAPVHLLDSQM
jgi:hypothetical protein